MLMHWLSLEPAFLRTMLILLTHHLWWRTCWLLTRPSFFVIDLLMFNLFQHWFTKQKKKDHTNN